MGGFSCKTKQERAETFSADYQIDIMNSFSQINYRHHHTLHFSINFSPFSSKPIISSISLNPPSKPKLSLTASCRPNSQNRHYKPLSETLTPLSSLIKTTCLAFTASFLFFTRFSTVSIAAPTAQPIVESTENTVSNEQNEKTIDKGLNYEDEDVDSLRSVMEEKIKDQKLEEAISIVEKLIQVEPLEKQWPLLKAHLQWYSGDVETAKLGFEEILSKDPLFVEAYHGLVTTVAPLGSGELEGVLKRIENAMEKCKVEKKEENLREFKLLVAQVRVMEGNYVDALKVCQELVKEEPKDFRPYLSQGIIYTLLRKTDEAKKQFEKYQSLVPKDHPYAQYFEDNVMTTRAFSEIMGKGKIS